MTEGPDRTRLWIAIEDMFILVSVFAIWPGILGWEGWVWEMTKYVAAVGLIWIFVRRLRRYQQRREAGGENKAS